MRLIIAGCEYSGASTLANAVGAWVKDALGASINIYDAFKIPHIAPFDMTDAEMDQFLALPTHIKQVYQWHNLASYSMPAALRKDDYIYVGFHLDEAVYAPLYYGYGRPWEYAEAVSLAHHYEVEIVETMPSLVQVLVKASPEVVAARMKANPHKRGLVQEGDIEHVLGRFEEVAEKSLIRRKITLDTSTATVDETLAEFVDKMDRYMSTHDLGRLAAQGQAKSA